MRQHLGGKAVHSVRVDAQPLVEHIDRLGGLGAAIARKERTGNAEAQRRMERRWTETWREGKRRGWFDLFWVDKFIVTVLEAHPFEVYPDWFDLEATRPLSDRRHACFTGSKLSEEQVLELRDKAKAGVATSTLAAFYDVGRRTVRDIINEHTWRHLLPVEEEAA